MAILFIDPGALRTELSLQAVAAVADGLGGFGEQWNEVATVLARIEPLAAYGRFGAGQTLETVTHRVTLRHRQDVRSGMRFSRTGRTFDIMTVHDPDESGRYLVCRVRETGA
jgi:SPP1 family predicted phage head-tail adaptor